MNDKFLYLEEIQGKKAREWVSKQNKITLDKFTRNPKFNDVYEKVSGVLFNENKVPYISMISDYVYNLWQDEKNVIGLLRRTTLDEYRKDHIQWETLIDFDELNQIENSQWFFEGCKFLESDHERCLINLSENGSDTVQIREFDLVEKQFIDNGFFIDLAKSQANWINKDEILVMTDVGENALTLSGYPRIVRRWKRGTQLEHASILFEGDSSDQCVQADYDQIKGFERTIIFKIINDQAYDMYVFDSQIKLDLPLDADKQLFRKWLIVKLRTNWSINSKFIAGCLLVIELDEFLKGSRDFEIIFQDTGNKILAGYTYTQDYLILSVMKDVVNHLEIYDPEKNFKYIDSIYSDEPYGHISIHSVENTSNDILIGIESFITPPAIYLVSLGNIQKTLLKTSVSNINPSEYSVEQHFVLSKDGTRIPYFQIMQNNNTCLLRPTLIQGYGGFGVSLLPYFLETEISTWISCGGVYVIANIRGGGEYGSKWHQQALKQHRHRGYEDFAAVAQDLINRGISSNKSLAAVGGSNGGLLMGNMLTQYPHLFAAIVCEVPLLDMLRYTKIGAGHSWVAEYGNPENCEDAAFLRTISPYHLLDNPLNQSKQYPAVLFYTTTSDDRVTPVHARKMAAKMKDMNIDNVSFYEQEQGGHSISANNKLSAFYTALITIFLMDALDIKI